MSLLDKELIELITQSALVLDSVLDKSGNGSQVPDELLNNGSKFSPHGSAVTCRSFDCLGVYCDRIENFGCVKNSGVNTDDFERFSHFIERQTVSKDFAQLGGNSDTQLGDNFDRAGDWIYPQNRSDIVQETAQTGWLCPYFGYYYDSGLDFSENYYDGLRNCTRSLQEPKVLAFSCYKIKYFTTWKK